MSPVAQLLPASWRDELDRVAAALSGFAADIRYFERVGSTNDIAADLAAGGAGEGTTVVAAMQTAGRGRQGRAWHSPPGAGLYFSIVFRPLGFEPLLTLMAGEATSRGIERATGFRPSLKWPNDLIVEPPGDDDAGLKPCATGSPSPQARWRKLGGILAEGAVTGTNLQHVVVGIGINVGAAAYPAELAGRVTSLEAELGRPVDVARVFAQSLAAIAEGRRDLVSGRAHIVLDRWRERAPSSRGRLVECSTAAGTTRGVTRGIDASGALIVGVGDRVERVIAGEVTWL